MSSSAVLVFYSKLISLVRHVVQFWKIAVFNNISQIFSTAFHITIDQKPYRADGNDGYYLFYSDILFSLSALTWSALTPICYGAFHSAKLGPRTIHFSGKNSLFDNHFFFISIHPHVPSSIQPEHLTFWVLHHQMHLPLKKTYTLRQIYVHDNVD